MAFINIGNAGFKSSRRGEYVDKSGLIGVVNNTLFTEQRYMCVSRCRRFGKSMAAKMLCAYYDRSCNSRQLFEDLEIAGNPTFEEHLNKYPVIYLDQTVFAPRFREAGIVATIDKAIREDIRRVYPRVPIPRGGDLMDYLIRINETTGDQFFFIIDEWDAICREFPKGTKTMDAYVNWLRHMFKTVNASSVFAGVYMTGILPIKKYSTESALNNFTEYSMVNPRKMACYFGFTKDEVRALATKYEMEFDDLEKWYDGYQIGPQPSMFNPNSVIQAIDCQWCESYWGRTGAYDSVATYISSNFSGLKDDVISMLGGGRVKVNTTKFQNDLTTIDSRDDVLTVLIHLGYLSYDRATEECYVPNYEVALELSNAVEDTGWQGVADALRLSRQLLSDTLSGDADAVARTIDAAHSDDTTILSYNNENSMACVLSLAYYYARSKYFIHRELASGKGFADLVMLPRKNVTGPAIVVELKCSKSAEAAIYQIKKKNYPARVAEYMADHSQAEILLVGINYDKKHKCHSCKIEALKS